MNVLPGCKTCVHWDIAAARDKAGRVRRRYAAKCLWPIPLVPSSARDTIRLVYMSALDGTLCQCWEERKP